MLDALDIRLGHFALLVLLVSCASSAPKHRREDWVDAIVMGDPMFGGAAFFAARLKGDPSLQRLGSDADLSRFFAAHLAADGEQAADLVRDVVPEPLARQVSAFLTSDAGKAMVAAEVVAMTAYRHEPDDFVARVAHAFSDPHGVGEAAVRQFEEVRKAMERGYSPSPAKLSVVIGAMRVLPVHAQAIATFNGSETGRCWIEARQRAFPLTEVRFEAFVGAAKKRGLVKLLAERENLILPRAEFAAPDAERKR